MKLNKLINLIKTTKPGGVSFSSAWLHRLATPGFFYPLLLPIMYIIRKVTSVLPQEIQPKQKSTLSKDFTIILHLLYINLTYLTLQYRGQGRGWEHERTNCNGSHKPTSLGSLKSVGQFAELSYRVLREVIKMYREPTEDEVSVKIVANGNYEVDNVYLGMLSEDEQCNLIDDLSKCLAPYKRR
jgi:hypothetical protein